MNLGESSWTAVSAALASGKPVVAILPCGATEAHGPHLPLCTDNIIGEGMARRAANILNQMGIPTFVLPTLAYAPADYAADFSGTVGISPASAAAVIGDIALSLECQGFACVALANAHFDPANVAMLRGVQAGSGTKMPIVFPDFTRRALAQTLTEEFQSGACHAGRFETSLVLADRQDLVDMSAATILPENPKSLTDAFRTGARSFAEAGGPEAYFGKPAAASSQEGQRSFEVMAQALVHSIREELSQAQ